MEYSALPKARFCSMFSRLVPQFTWAWEVVWEPRIQDLPKLHCTEVGQLEYAWQALSLNTPVCTAILARNLTS